MVGNDGHPADDVTLLSVGGANGWMKSNNGVGTLIDLYRDGIRVEIFGANLTVAEVEAVAQTL